MNYLLIDPPVHIYSSACLQGKNMGRFSHWSEQKKLPNVPAIPEVAVLGLHRTLFFGTALSTPTEET